jgi:Tol biopolymer transport system component
MNSAAFSGLAGRTLGAYRLEELIGIGGMGEVYKAQDLRLGRVVAVKVLPRSFGDNLERVGRFEREARAASAINHPHIAAIYDVGCVDGVNFMAMEYVEGQTLYAWLGREGREIPEALTVLEQVADALARAHDAGVLHRDVKPANVMVARNGYAKLLDFGLAKVAGEQGAATGSAAAPLSQTGAVVGTLAYMSPEQARGQRLDRRSDVFSFGALLYEVVVGRPPFTGASEIEAVGSTLRDDPIRQLADRGGLGDELRRLIVKSLEKDPARRYQHMDDLLVDLRAARRAQEAGEAGPRLRAARRQWLVALAGLGAGLLAGMLAWRERRAPEPPPVLGAGLVLRPLTQAGALHRGPALAPTGDLVSYACDREGSFDIMVQQADSGRPLRVTEDPGDELDPAFSPDGQTLAFATSDGRVATVPALGGQARTLAGGGAGDPVWSPDGRRVLFRIRRALHTVSRTGGASSLVIEDPAFPVLGRAAWSPDGRAVVFPSIREGRLALARVPSEGGPAAVVGSGLASLSTPVFSADGRWLFGTSGFLVEQQSEIWAARVAEDGQLADPTRVLGGALAFLSPSVSRDQRRIAFEVHDAATSLARLSLTEPAPAKLAWLELPARSLEAVVSHAGDALALVSDRAGEPALWRTSLASGALERLREGEGADGNPAWSPDDRRIAFAHVKSGRSRIATIPAGGGESRFLSAPDTFAGYPAWSPDGATLAFVTLGAAGGEIRTAPADGGPESVLATTAQRFRRISWSPDARWIAASVRAAEGGWSVGVTPATGGAFREVLPDARAPLWLADGRLIFAREGPPGSWDLWSVTMGPQATPQAGSERRLTSLPRGQSVDRERGASSDGRFLYLPVQQLVASDVWLGEVR